MEKFIDLVTKKILILENLHNYLEFYPLCVDDFEIVFKEEEIEGQETFYVVKEKDSENRYSVYILDCSPFEEFTKVFEIENSSLDIFGDKFYVFYKN